MCHARLLELRSISGAVGMGGGDGVLERIEFEVVEDGSMGMCCWRLSL